MRPPQPFKPFALTLLDQAYGKVFFHYSLSFNVQDENRALQAISQGIDELLALLPFLTGEMAPHPDANGTLEVRPATSEQKTPMLKVQRHANCFLPVRKIGQGPGAFRVPQNFPLNDRFNPLPSLHAADQPAPIVRFQANLLEDGVVLTTGFNHLVFDAIGGSVIVGILADLCRNPGSADGQRGSAIMARELFLRKQVEDLISRVKSDHAHGVITKSLTSGDETTETASAPAYTASAPPQPVKDECLVFAGERIEQLRGFCNSILPWLDRQQQQVSEKEEVVDKPRRVSSISGNDVLSALICESIERARRLKGPRPDCMLGVDARGFLNPPFPENYMGNAGLPLCFQLQSSSSSAPEQETSSSLPQELLETAQAHGLTLDMPSLLTIAKSAYTIQAGLSNFHNTSVDSLLSFINAGTSGAKQKADPAPRPPCTILSTLRPVKFHEMHFGPDLGGIQTFETGVPWLDGACMVLPLCVFSPETVHLAPWSVRIALYQDVMQRLKSDSAIVWALQ
ncbi:uncharacterized protein BDV14DRAFT_196239 [Aspergillus stella-maris]|uniref:uncharacterized protein n=1 Tax=Aspergillus stella-maris TaxID=1810926 RepID=UPI003CCCDCC6